MIHSPLGKVTQKGIDVLEYTEVTSSYRSFVLCEVGCTIPPFDAHPTKIDSINIDLRRIRKNNFMADLIIILISLSLK
jgi:hypothetical protein